ncbi:N-acetyl-gamma-glutamyl-phosphate reductase 1 [Sphaerisporangium melleum]|uniref:N-acetyl-gamma-glutamyl-phosphate reductase n=1 Tax=Sphaerisporangium melleum TaxID=321316 RepID=A0A917RFQ7_9ACTN|nr:N-acetyl-gamma-glutamyl-phosphate reductase [Sphaerisporangium melleum]GGL05928.1 N-acetyl-gamma-glutamyl-phosphate reductase 1 [Sphaerisporangium melleum]GII73141.1 N-acetyl-gamma-glutamyl-phosphate reductase 1 [Sphaerisporangium melleum]
MTDRIKVAVLGASGFIGAEVIRLLSAHPQAEVAFMSSQQHAGKPLGQVVSGLRNSRAAGRRLRSLDELSKVDVAISCLPNGVLPKVLDDVSGQADLVLNVAGDYRLRDPEEIAQYYPGSVGGWRQDIPYYVPEFGEKPSEPVVNLPGCMASAGLYALYPLFRDGLAEPRAVVDAKTGSSGGGNTTTENPSLRAGNVRVHKLHGHRHGPEIRQALATWTGTAPELQFSAFSLPVVRGVFATAYTWLREGAGTAEVRRAYARAYADAPFVRMSNGRSPVALPMLKTVVGSNTAEVGVSVEGSRCVAVCALDNLIKGGAGQAVQAMNRVFGLEETLGLPEVGPWP